MRPKHQGSQTVFRIIGGPAASCNRLQKFAAFSGNSSRFTVKTVAQSQALAVLQFLGPDRLVSENETIRHADKSAPADKRERTAKRGWR
jgi:hypothetical protein